MREPGAIAPQPATFSSDVHGNALYAMVYLGPLTSHGHMSQVANSLQVLRHSSCWSCSIPLQATRYNNASRLVHKILISVYNNAAQSISATYTHTLIQVLGNTCSEAGEKQQTWGPCQPLVLPHITFLLQCRTCQCTHKHAILVSVTPRAHMCCSCTITCHNRRSSCLHQSLTTEFVERRHGWRGLSCW